MKPRCQHQAGFTLSEVLVAAALGGLVMAGITTTYIMSVKGFRAISNYAEIHAAGRAAIDRFSRDMRAVHSIVSFSPSNLVVTVPTDFTASGGVSSSKTITYAVQQGALYRTDSTSGTRLLATNIHALTFSLYDKVGSNTTVLSTAKGIQLDLRLRKRVLSQIQSEDYLSARFDMRNKP
jgi:prepilin-type N-terminal cleavage/methylation domain-containing protein